MKGVLQIALEQARKVVMPGNVNSVTKIGCKKKKKKKYGKALAL